MPSTRTQLVRDSYAAYASGDRQAFEALMAEGFVFSAPPDVGLDRAGYFERCWPGSETLERFDYARLVEAEGEVVATYEATRTDGHRFRNTEIFGFEGDRIRSVEVYFGWNLD
jgi:ketosteroid isomerase-like protein